MRNNFKRFLGVAFVLIMALSVMTVGAFAAEETNVAKVGETEYATLAGAIKGAKVGETITLTADVTENVTLSKNLTIDGNGNKYTGKMTANAGINVTVKNVNFVNGGMDKKTTSTTGIYTFKDCTFDGEGKYAYPLRFYGANTITVEDCTVKDYMYSFLYLPSATLNASVKNVTVEDCPSYAVYFASGVTNATFENLTVKNSNNGFVINNVANRSFTINNCNMENVNTAINYSGGTYNINCTVNGVNDFGGATLSEFAALKLTEGATLTAPEGLAVSTDVEDSYVAYKNGVYSVEANTKVAAIGDAQYKTLADAIAAATKGATITLLADVNENVTLSKNLTINGNGNKYTGTMTVGSNLTITVKNVNFVNGGVSKSTKASNGNYTVKDCTFDGEGEYAYPLLFKGASTITVENCAVKDYLYGFLYVSSGTDKATVKNVTVENCPDYAVYFGSGVNTATFENLTVKNSGNGFVINNTANRSFTIKNCTMENVDTAINHANGTKTITCTANGVNDFGGAALSKYVKVKAAAQIGTKFYNSLMTAVADAKDGDVITLVSDIALANSDAKRISVDKYNWYTFIDVSDKAITIDLNGKVITATPSFDDVFYGVIAVSGTGNVTLKDSSEAKTGAINVTMAEGTKAYSLLTVDGDKSKLTINGGNYYIDKIEAGYSMIYVAQTGTGYVNGGNFVLGNAYSYEKQGAMVPWIFNTYANGKNFVEVKGGTYNVNPQNRWNEVKFPKGYVAYEDVDGVWKVARGPVIVKQPTDITIGYNKMAQFAPVIAGDNLTYTWYYKDTNTRWYTSTLTTATYDIKGLVSRDGRQVYCVATDSTGKSVTTEIATLHVVPNEELAIVSQPTVVEGTLNKTVSVALDVTGDALTYVWYYSDNGGKSYYKSSLTTETYDFILKEERMGRKVYCVITDAFGDTVKSDVITINAVQSVELKLNAALTYEAVAVGKTAKITLDVQGEGLTYTWYYSLPGKTTFYKSSITDSEYKLTLSADRVGRNVYCVITDAFGNSIQTETVTLYAAE